MWGALQLIGNQITTSQDLYYGATTCLEANNKAPSIGELGHVRSIYIWSCAYTLDNVTTKTNSKTLA